jgi:hypothetical protein
MKPIVGLCIRDNLDAEAEIYERLRALGINVFRFEPDNFHRYHMLCNVKWVRERVVCVIDDDIEMITEATSLGFHAVVWRTPENAHWPWHLVATSVPDLAEGVAYRLKEWRYKHRDDLRSR